MKSLTVAFAAVLALLIAGQSSHAQTQQRRTLPAPQAAPTPPPDPAPEAPPPSYEPELLRLAELLGSLSYLSKLCGAKEIDSWQTQMEQLLEAEAPTKSRKERLAGAYNRGYLGYQPAHRSCSEGSRNAIERFLEQGQKITSDLSRRYGG